MSRKRLSIEKLTPTAVLALLAIAGCSTVIGLGDYKVGPNGSDAGNSGVGGSDAAGASEGGSDVGVGGSKSEGGSTPIGGTSSGGKGGSNEAGAPSGGSAEAGMSAGGSAEAGMSAGGGAGTSVGGTSTGGHGGATGACPQGCDDGIACTIDLCDTTGCVHTPANALCNGTCMKCDVALGCVDASTTKELLSNGNLDTGAGTGWVKTSDDNLTLIKAPPAGVTAVSSPNVIWLGQLDDEHSFVSQPITIPAGTASLTVSGYSRVRSLDTLDGSDQAWIDLVTDPTDPSTFLSTFSNVWFNEDVGTAFVAFSENADMSTITPPQSLSFMAFGLNDVSDVSDFFFDSLSLKAKICTQ